MQRVVCAATSKEVTLGTTGQSWPTFDLGETSVERFGAAYWMVHRGDFHRVLLDAVHAVRPDAVAAGNGCVGYDQTDDRVTLHLANGEQAAWFRWSVCRRISAAWWASTGLAPAVTSSLTRCGAARS